jgi:cob(I)alamin adenosyltransferase
MVRLNRIYTKAGDGGDTRLVGGQKVRKDSLRIEAYGTIDELSACIGLARTVLAASGAPDGADALAAILRRVQNELFNLGSDLATLTADRRPNQPVIEARHATMLEQEIDGWNETLPELRSFVLARTVCRRAERLIVRLADAEPIGAAVIPYVNRLSDALFVMSRHAARLYGEPEPLWEPEET